MRDNSAANNYSAVKSYSTVNARRSKKLNVRGVVVFLHRYMGLALALFLIIAGVTGTAIAFYKELDQALNPELYRIIERKQPVLNADALVQKIAQAYPQAFVNVMMLDRSVGESVRVRLSPLRDPISGKYFVLNYNEIFLDPFDGRILGGRAHGEFHFDRAHLMPFIYSVHYSLYMPDKWGDWLMGIVALIWMFDCFVGFYVTLPARAIRSGSSRKNWWQRWKPAWQIKRGASGTRLNFDIHRATGLWLWLVLFMLAFTGVYFNLTREIFRPVLGWVAPLTPETTTILQQQPQAFAPLKISFEQAIAAAHKVRSPLSQRMVLSYIGLTPDAPGIYRVRFADANRGDANWKFHYENLFIDGATGALVRRVGYDSGTAADKFILWQYPLHSGQVFGFWGRVFIGATGIAVAVLSITGIIIWWRKRRALRVRTVVLAKVLLKMSADLKAQQFS
ncbi:MAG: PepSY-associated helix domain protein [Verrucomicrobiaceae bacterium]|nr:PepSY-associated helix domain protein [Verrucomicrobiaceae bacterium]